MLDQHKYYVYHEGNVVYARMDDQERVVVETCETPHAAYLFVQKIVNPDRLQHDDAVLEGRGFNHPEFQEAISENCKATVLAAYGDGSIPI